MRVLIGCCGLDCEQCGAYIATKSDDDALREKTAKEWTEMNNHLIKPEWINCEGCRADGIKFHYCSEMCEIRKCVHNKGFETCGDCPEMVGCETVKMIHEHCDEAIDNLKG